MKRTISVLGGCLCALIAAAAGPWCQAPFDVVDPKVPDRLCPAPMNGRELGGEIDRRLRNLIRSNYMVVDLDGKWLDHFRNRTSRGSRSHVYYGIGKVLDAGSLFAAYTGDPEVAARTQYLVDELVKSRDPDGYLGFWSVEPENRQNHINWILHEQEYINLAFVRHYRCTGDPRSLAHARSMGDYILRTFPTPRNPCYDAREICTAGLPEGMLELYRVTGDRRYFDFAADVPHGNNRGEVQFASLRAWDQDFSRPPRHVYVMLARCYAQTELYRLSGETNLLRMSRYMRNELLKQGEGGLLVTGSCSDGEQFTYNQNGRGAIGESCVTAYLLRWFDSLMRLEGDLRYGDVLERTMYNALFAANSPDGRWIRYFTPFSGERLYDTRDSFCCCGNYRRAVAELSRKVYYRTPEGGIALNLFTNSKKSFDVNGQSVTISQETAYPNDGEVALTFSTGNAVPFAFRFRTPRWCERMTVRVNDEPPMIVRPVDQADGCCVLDRTWGDGDTVRISMSMTWRFLRGRAMQDGRVALLRGPVVYCLGKDQNPDLFAKCAEPRDLVIDPASIGEPEKDETIRPGGRKVAAKAWLARDGTREEVDITLTEFIDPSGLEVYFRAPNLADTLPVRLAEDEIVSCPSEFVNVHILRALYGPKASGDLEAMFEVRGPVAADLAADYVPPGGRMGVKAEFPDSTGGSWACSNSKNGGLLSTAAPGDVKMLNSQFKAFGTPLGYAYGLENQGDQLGFVSNYAPSDRQEEVWRNHYSEKMFDWVIPVGERNAFLYTHPVADVGCSTVFRWTPSASVRAQSITVCGRLFSNLGNGVELRVIRWNDDTRHDVLGTFNTRNLAAGQCGFAEFTLPLRSGAAGRHLDFVLHNAGTHVCDASALRIQVFTDILQSPAQADVTKLVQAVFRNQSVTPLGSYDTLFGEAKSGSENTLKVKVRDWRDGHLRYLEFPQDAVLDLTRK